MRTFFIAGSILALGLAAAGAASSQPASAPTPTPAPAQTTPTPAPASPTIDSTYGSLMADPATKAVLARDIPTIVAYDAQEQIQGMTIRQIAHFPQAGIDDAKLNILQADLAAAVATHPAP